MKRIRSILEKINERTGHGPRFKVLAIALLLAVSGASALWAFREHLNDIAQHHEGLDFHDYYFTAKAVVRGAGVYDHQAMQRLALAERKASNVPVFVYPPLIIALFMPFTQLSYTTVRIGWLVLNQLFLATALFGAARIVRARTGARIPATTIAISTLLATATSPVLNHNWQGQSNFLVLALTTWALYFALRDEPSNLWCGAFLAPAILLKVFPAIFIPFLLARRQWKAVLHTAAWALAITALTLPVIDWHDYLAYPKVLANSTYLGPGGPTVANLSMDATGRLLASIGHLSDRQARIPIALLRYAPCALLPALAALEARRESALRGLARLVPALRLSEGFLLMGCIMGKWWIHHLVQLIVPYFFAAYLVTTDVRRFRLPALLLGASLLLVSTIYHPLVWAMLSAHDKNNLLDVLWETDRLAIAFLFAALEISIQRLTLILKSSPARLAEP